MLTRWTWLVLIVAMAAGAQAQDARAPAPGSDLAASRVFDAESLPVTHNANGSERRDFVRNGRLATGEAVHIHASMQPPGIQPGPAHTIQHSEFILVTEGTLEISLDGKTSRAGPGSIVYVAHGTLHQARNVGPGPVKYTVVAIGGDAK